MKLLFDQNLSFRLVATLVDIFPDSTHVRTIGLAESSDLAVRDYASTNGHTIVSNDDDFPQMSILRGAPPKVIWLQVGNCSTDVVEKILRGRYPVIETFSRDAESSFLIVPTDAVQQTATDGQIRI